MLIKNNKAQIYISAQQLLRELMWDATSPSDRPQVKALETQLSEKQQLIISCFKGDNLVSLEEIHQGVELEIHEVSVLLMELELEGVIRMLHGNKYQLLNVVVG